MTTNTNSKLSGGTGEPHEPSLLQIEQATADLLMAEQLLLDYLLDSGFTWEESIHLATLREHLYEGPEMRERVLNDYRLHFAQWLYEHGEIGQ